MLCLRHLKPNKNMRLISKLVLVALAWYALFPAGIAAQSDDNIFFIRSSATGKVVFSGVADVASAGSAGGGMLYGPGLIGFIASVAIHGGVSSGIQRSQISKQQEDADKVLLPYANGLDKFDYFELMERIDKEPVSRTRFSKDNSRTDGEWMLDVVPSFRMAQDQSSVMVESTAAFYAPNNNFLEKPDHKVVIKVWSMPEVTTQSTTATNAKWAANDAEHVKNLAADLTRQSIGIAMKDWAQRDLKDMSEHASVRLMQGKVQTIERAQIIDKQCERVLIRTLRNVLISAPTPAFDSEICVRPAYTKKMDEALPKSLSSVIKASE
jgi:hypothetical protein